MARARQYAALTVAGSSVLAVRARKRLGLPALFTTASAYVTPVAIAAGFRRSRIRAAAASRLAATFDLTLVAYWGIPTAPPWWASEKTGRLDGAVRRVMSEVASWVKREPNPTEGDHELGANPFAAMPSDHFASAAMT